MIKYNEIELKGSKDVRVLSLEDFYSEVQPEKLNSYLSVFGVERINQLRTWSAQEEDEGMKELYGISALYRELIGGKGVADNLNSKIKNYLFKRRWGGASLVLSELNRASIEIAQSELFEISLFHAIKVKEIEKTMFDYIVDLTDGTHK